MNHKCSQLRLGALFLCYKRHCGLLRYVCDMNDHGFEIFERSGKGASLTPAGSQFVTYLANMREEMKRAIEQI